MKILKTLMVMALAISFGTTAQAKKDKNSGHTYTFGRFNQEGVTPRGGTTEGGKITLDKRTAKSFKRIKRAKTKKEKDRMAILSQVGEFKVSFEFIETIGFDKGYKLDQPYRSWATEYVFPIKSDDEFISLQHILVMQFKDDKGKLSDPMVVKHWRQDWHYEKSQYPIYMGHMTWKKRQLNPAAIKGTWTQAVYQVDDSPRYFGHGKWKHTPQMSVWRSEPTTRPLPRREFSIRSDYNLMQGVNTVTVLPTGWYHEQNNYKVKVNKKTLRPIKTIAKEVGLNSYQRIKSFDFKPGQEYWDKTSIYWAAVRDYWSSILNDKDTIRLKLEKDGKKMFARHFEFAKKIKDGEPLPAKAEDYVKHTIDDYLY